MKKLNFDPTYLIKFRKNRDLSQADIARMSGLSSAAISLIEVGDRNPTSSTLIHLSRGLNVSVDALLGLAGYSDSEFNLRAKITKLEQKLESINELSNRL